MGQWVTTKEAESASGLRWVTASHRTLPAVAESLSLGPNPFGLPRYPQAFKCVPWCSVLDSGVGEILVL